MSTSKTSSSSRFDKSSYGQSGSGSFYKSIKSYSSKGGGGHGHGDISLQQISEAKEVFGDMEDAYKSFKLQIEELRKEHRIEVSTILFKLTDVVAFYSRRKLMYVVYLRAETDQLSWSNMITTHSRLILTTTDCPRPCSILSVKSNITPKSLTDHWSLLVIEC